MSERDLSAEPEEVQQHEEETTLRIDPVPVVVEGNVRAQTMGSVVSVMRSFTVTETAEQILGRDPRRRRAVILSIDQPVYLGPDAQLVNGGHGFLLTNGVPLEVTHTDPLWVAVALLDGSSVVSILIEQWAL